MQKMWSVSSYHLHFILRPTKLFCPKRNSTLKNHGEIIKQIKFILSQHDRFKTDQEIIALLVTYQLDRCNLIILTKNFARISQSVSKASLSSYLSTLLLNLLCQVYNSQGHMKYIYPLKLNFDMNPSKF
jgi:hypothetical protein